MINRAYISINNVCNLNCSYCSFRTIDAILNDEPLTISDVEIILCSILTYSQANKLEKFVIGICGAGEPLLHYDTIKHMIRWAEKADVDGILHFYTITNGTLITDEMIDFFYTHKDHIELNFSLDGYEEIHNIGKAKYKDVMEGLRKYKNIFGNYPIIQCTVTKQTLQHKEKVVDFFIQEGFLKINFGFLFDVDDAALFITYNQYVDFLHYIAKYTPIISRQNKKEKKYDCRIYGNYCSVGRNNPFITKQGVYPCCRFYRNERYRFAEYTTPIDEMESVMMERYTPVMKGACYYEMYAKQVQTL
jgi:uncharacterized protein